MEKMKVTDELLEQVVPKLSDEMLDEYENSGDGEHKFSERFEKKMKRLIWQEKHKLHEIRTGAVIKMVAGLIAVLGVAFFFASMDSKADPRLFFEKMEVILEDSSLYVYDEELDNYNFTPYEPTYVPEGYEEVSRKRDDTIIYIDYVNEDGKTICWKQRFVVSGSVMGIDAEYDELVVLEYAGENITIRVYEDEYKSLYYESGNSIFMMTADNISVKDMYEMIRQMERVEKIK